MRGVFPLSRKVTYPITVNNDQGVGVGTWLVALLLLLASAPTPAAPDPPRGDTTGEPIVVGSVHRIASSVYGGPQTLTLRLPRGYADDPERRYPVLFSVDGGPEQDFELLAGIAAEAEFSGSFERFILIGVRTDDRYSQLTPGLTRLAPERLRANFGDRIKPGGADRFRAYLATDVIPWPTARYRTERRIVTAASLGGLFVLDTFLEAPGMFDDYIALTPAVWWDDGRIVDEAAAKMVRHAPSDRRVYFTIGDEGVGNRTGAWLTTLVGAFESGAPEGLKWAFVDRSGSEEHRTMALTGWLDAMRTLYLTPARTGTALGLVHNGYATPAYTPEVRDNLDAGTCRRAIAKPLSFAEKNARPDDYFGMCVLMKPGPATTAGNLTAGDFGR